MAIDGTNLPMGAAAPDFALPDPSGRTVSLTDAAGPNGVVVAFICNHCPYVVAVADRIADAADAMAEHGVGFVAIMANDWQAYPQDAPERMVEFAARYGFSFPYLVDESQDVARSYGALCTPEFFGFDAGLMLRYRGRLDESGRQPGPRDARRDLVDAMIAVAAGQDAPTQQAPARGCSIKWRS